VATITKTVKSTANATPPIWLAMMIPPIPNRRQSGLLPQSMAGYLRQDSSPNPIMPPPWRRRALKPLRRV
jgi:hypothetical protein